MIRSRWLRRFFLALAMCAPLLASAQYPNKPIKVIVPYPAGTAADAMARIVAPAGVPADIVNRLNAEINKTLNDPAMRDRMEADGTKVFTSTPDEFSALMKSDVARWADIVKKSGIRID